MKVKEAIRKVRVGETLIPISDEGFYRSKGRLIFKSREKGFYTIAGNLYVSPETHNSGPFPDAVQLTEWTRQIEDATPYEARTVSRIVAGNYGDIYILYK